MTKNDAILKYAGWLLAALFAALLLMGCGSSLQTVEVPAAPPSINAQVDTLLDVRPLEIGRAGIPTLPTTYEVFEDTLDAPSTRVVSVGVTAQTVTITLSDRRYTYHAPAHGETLTVLAEDDSTLSAQVAGKPKTQTVKAKVKEQEPGFFERVKDRILWGVGGGLVLISIIAGIRLYSPF